VGRGGCMIACIAFPAVMLQKPRTFRWSSMFFMAMSVGFIVNYAACFKGSLSKQAAVTSRKGGHGKGGSEMPLIIGAYLHMVHLILSDHRVFLGRYRWHR
jgi:hypothetical protein